ncbi:ABC transporter permease [Pseudoxanthomonas sp.]|uniref:ABC transporter permease n=1 Tax=Pseudoxanthomonas sp. TaxID=1871049 RepID=UPI0028C42DD4|nr:ABC transporter permease [Pseudoxanthomonas sp.]
MAGPSEWGGGVNPHAAPAVSPVDMVRSLWSHRRLLGQLSRREVASRYKGAAMGVAWSFITPMLMLAVYTFVFSVVFKARWGSESAPESNAQFAIIMFVGIVVHGLFAEVVNRAPSLILGNVNYVKKVVFPLEILPGVVMSSALFHMCVSLLVLFGAMLFINGTLSWTTIFLPIVVLPLMIFTLGLAWFLAALGVFLRDVSQVTSILTMIMLFLAPVFYPISAIPEKYRWLIMANPLTFIIEQAREVVIWGHFPNFAGLAAYSAIALAVAWLGFVWFQKTRKGFADVL